MESDVELGEIVIDPSCKMNQQRPPCRYFALAYHEGDTDGVHKTTVIQPRGLIASICISIHRLDKSVAIAQQAAFNHTLSDRGSNKIHRTQPENATICLFGAPRFHPGLSFLMHRLLPLRWPGRGEHSVCDVYSVRSVPLWLSLSFKVRERCSGEVVLVTIGT